MLNCFLHDKSLHTKTTGIAHEADKDAGYGYLTDYLKSYFNVPTILPDSRTNRLVVEGVQSDYRMELHFDHNEYDLEPDIDYSALTQTELDALFNIIEALAFNVVADDDAYETLLTGSVAFDIYTPESLVRSVTQATVDFTINQSAAPVEVEVREWVSFECTLNGFTQTYKVWFGRDEFAADYPHTTFTHITYPDDPARLLAGTYTSGVSAMAAGSDFASTDLNVTVSGSDNTGVKKFTSVYNPGGTSNVLNPAVSFLVFYKGKEPSTQQVREHIRDDLLGLSLAIEDVWKTILPALFVNGRYFFVPLWDNFVLLPGDITLRSGIMNYKKALDLMLTVFSSYDPQFVEDNMEITLSSASDMYLIGLPSEDTDSEDPTLAELYPTYQPIDGTVAFFDNQTIETQEFNVQLAAAIAVLTGASNNLTFGEDEFEGRQWLTFSANYQEYHVLKSDQFPEVY